MDEDRSHTASRRGFLRATGAAGAAAALAGVAGASEGRDREELIVGVTGSASTASVAARLPEELSVRRRNDRLGYVLAAMPADAGVYDRMRLESEVATIPEVKYTEENAVAYLHDRAPADVGAVGTSDPTSEADDPKLSDQYAPQQVDAPAAWDTTRGSDGVTVAVIDTGIAYDHPDLKDRFGDLKGKDFGDNDDDPYPPDTDTEQHASHVSGIASATTNNGEGIAGMSDSRLLSCRVAGEDGQTWAARTADALQWAADQGADVINISLGHPTFDTETVHNAVKYATNSGALIFASAGNDSREGVAYPAAFEEVVCVAALDENEDHAEFSNYGEKVDITGPGVDVLSCNSDWEADQQDYIEFSGTSMSSPAVAGVAALGKAVAPDVSPERLRQRLEETAVDVGLPEKKQGAGKPDAAALVDALGDGSGGGNEAPSASFTVSASTVGTGTEVSFDAAGSEDPDGSLTGYEWNFGDGATASGETATHTYTEPGEYNASLEVTDDRGATASASRTITVESGDCATTRRTKTRTGTIESSDDKATYTHELGEGTVCDVTITLSGPEDTDFDLFVTLDGRTPTPYDYDRRSYSINSEEEVQIQGSELTVPGELGILVDPFSGSGEFELTVEEFGSSSGGGGGGNEGPTAKFTMSPETAAPGEFVYFSGDDSTDSDGAIANYEWAFGDGTTGTGERTSTDYDEPGEYEVTLTVTDDRGATDSASKTVTVEEGGDNEGPSAAFKMRPGTARPDQLVYVTGSDSEDEDGSIESYEWEWGDGATATGESANHSYDDTGEYEVTLTVIDDQGATDSASKTVTVEKDDDDDDDDGDDGGSRGCKSTHVADRLGDSLDGMDDRRAYEYDPKTDDLCRLVVVLDGPSDADFDLYLTTDGTTPTQYDYDHKSTSNNSQERIELTAPKSDTTYGLLVHSWMGGGDYELRVEEFGR